MTDQGDPYDDEALAAEYVLRFMDDSERRAFEARLSGEPDLRSRVHRWEADFAGFGAEVPPERPPASLRKAVLEAIAPATRDGRPSRLWTWLGGLAVAGLAAVVFLTVAPEDTDQSPAYRAELASADRGLVLQAAVTADARQIVVEPQVGTPPEGRVLELWLIAEGAEAPVSLGVLESGERTRIDVPGALAASLPTGTLAISDEPPGGSPTGAPTGEVLATATLSAG